MSSGATVPAGTRERLLEAARHTVEQGGYRAASVLAIADRAGVAAGTMYRHFPSKQELFVELFRDVCGRELRAMHASAVALGPDAAAIDRLETVLATFAERALRNPLLAWALIAEPVDPLVDAERLRYRAHYADLCGTLLTEAIAAGEVPEQDVELTAAALVGGCGEALVGPLSPLGYSERPAQVMRSASVVVAALQSFVRRAVGAAA